MATRKRKTTAAKRRKPTTRKRAAVRSRSTTASFRKSNPTKKRRTTKARLYTSKRRSVARRNPSVTSEIFEFTLAGVGLGIAQPFVSPLIARFLPLGQFTQPASAAISGYGLGWLAEKFALTRRFGRPLKVLGVSAAAIGIVSPLVRGLISPGAPAQGMQGPRRIWRGANGIALVPDVPPALVPAPPPPRQNSGMNGMATVPAQFRR